MQTEIRPAGLVLEGRQIWHEAVRELSQELATGPTSLLAANGGTSALNWLRQLDIAGYQLYGDCHHFTISVPNRFALDYVDSYLRGAIERSLSALARGLVTLDFQIRAGMPPAVEAESTTPPATGGKQRAAERAGTTESAPPRDAQVDITNVSSDSRITVEELDWDPTQLGWSMTSNYFKHFWMGLIGHEAAALYELIKSFCYGSKDDAHPSVARLAASMRVDRHKLTGRKRKKPNGEEYREEGLFDVLRRYRLLWVIVRGSGRESEYVFKIVKNPPLLLPSQVLELRPPLQELHRRLLAKSDDAFQAYIALAEYNGEEVPDTLEGALRTYSAAEM